MERQLITLKIETAYGEDSTPLAANTLWVEDFNMTPGGQRVASKVSKPGVGPTPSQTYGQHRVVTFKFPLNGSGVAGTAPKWAPIPKICGWSETIVAVTSVAYGLRVDPENADSATMYVRDGNLRSHKVMGLRGRLSFDLSAGARLMGIFNGIGLFVPMTEAVAPLAHADANFAGWLDTKPVSSTTTQFTFAGVSDLGIRQLNVEQSDNVMFEDLPGQLSVELLGERKFTGRTSFTSPKPSVLNVEQKWVDSTVETFSMVHGATAGKILTVNGRAQMVEPTFKRERGKDVVDLGLEIVPSTLTTDDDLALILT